MEQRMPVNKIFKVSDLIGSPRVIVMQRNNYPCEPSPGAERNDHPGAGVNHAGHLSGNTIGIVIS